MQANPCKLFIRDVQHDHAMKLHVLQPSVTATSQGDLLLYFHVHTRQAEEKAQVLHSWYPPDNRDHCSVRTGCTEQGLPNNSMAGTVGANTALTVNSEAGGSMQMGLQGMGAQLNGSDAAS